MREEQVEMVEGVKQIQAELMEHVETRLKYQDSTLQVWVERVYETSR